MVGAKLIGSWVAVALALLALVSGAAAADSGPGRSVTLELHGTHGYRVFVMAGQRPIEAQGRIVVIADKRGSGVSYTAPATVTPTSLEADLGAVGHISLQLQPTGTKQADRDCDGKRVEYDGANWVGEFELHGEERFTTVSKTRLPFSLKPVFRLLCGTSIVGGRSSGNGAFLHVGAKELRPDLNLVAWTEGPGKAVEVSASVHEQSGEVEIERTVERRFPSSAFNYAPDLSSASLRPPAPFSGYGVFRRGVPPATRWSGNLSIDFPGRSAVPATGAPLRPELTHDEWPSTKR